MPEPTTLPQFVQYTLTPEEDFIFQAHYAMGCGILTGEKSTPDVLVILRNLRRLMANDERFKEAARSLYMKVKARNTAQGDVHDLWGPR